MLTIWAYKIKHSTLGSSFSVTFSVPPTELEYLTKLYDYFNSMNMRSFPTNITADRKTEPQQVTSKLASVENPTVSACESTMSQPNGKLKDEPRMENPCDGCVCDDGKHLMYCMNCKGIAWKTEPPKDEPQEREGE